MILLFKIQVDTYLSYYINPIKSGFSEHTNVRKKRNIFYTIFVWILDKGIVFQRCQLAIRILSKEDSDKAPKFFCTLCKPFVIRCSTMNATPI